MDGGAELNFGSEEVVEELDRDPGHGRWSG